jgi:polyhydroxyalkanoate synthesis regulator phasin
MNANNFSQFVQQSYRVAVGAAATLLETLQDSQKRESTISELQSQWNQRVEEWAEKGEVTEQEARRTVETWLHKQQRGKQATETDSSQGAEATAPPPADTAAQAELKALTQEIVALRTELEESRQ